jgi:transcriptional regulator with XRE-family HTH domain
MARELSGLSQRALADLVGVTGSAVAQWESGLASPSIVRLSKLAEALGVSVDALIGGPDHVKGSSPKDATASEDLALMNEARRLGLDLHEVVREARRQEWLRENRGALADANAFLKRYGLWSDGKRQF